MKLSVIVIPRISPSTAAAAAARCQQVVPYTKPPFSSNEATASSSCPKNSFNPSSHPPKNSICFLLSLPQFSYYHIYPSIFAYLYLYLTLLKPPHLTSLSLSPHPHQPLRKKPLLPMRRRSLSFHKAPFFHFGSIVHVDGIGRSGVPVFEVDDGSS